MSRLTLLLLAAALPLCLAPTIQKRAKKSEPADFDQLMNGAREDWTEKRFGQCLEKLRSVTALATQARADNIRASLPAAPAGYSVVKAKEIDLASNPMLAGIASATGNIIEKEYREDGGGGNVRVTVNADSPMVKMVAMMFNNPMIAQQEGELIEYEHGDRAILKDQGGTLNLQILIDEKHLTEVRMRGLDEEALFRMFSQEAIDKLRAALAN